jgi:hypothetical protein
VALPAVTLVVKEFFVAFTAVTFVANDSVVYTFDPDELMVQVAPALLDISTAGRLICPALVITTIPA